MEKPFIGLLLNMFGCFVLHAQQTFMISGSVLDSKTQLPIDGVVVEMNGTYAVTDIEGNFNLKEIPQGNHTLKASSLGYNDYFEVMTIVNSNVVITILMEESTTSLKEVVVKGETPEQKAREIASVVHEISEEYLKTNRENSLMQTLKKLPGISAMSIGSGQSKPSIRGLGFNRVAVVQNGIKHEAQQWGSDHGLEIDQYDVGNIQIIKGPVSLLYGSDAIGGVLNIKPDEVPADDSSSGEVNLLAETNNDLLGVSTGVQARKGKWYYRGRLTFRDYADYKVPTNKIVYENYVFNLYDNNLRNTAGTEANASISAGYLGEDFRTETYVSNVNAKNGFFANAHGLEVRTSTIDYDAHARDVDLPYHKVNHFKVTNNTEFFRGNHILRVNLGFQNNVREEHSEPVAHGFMPAPNGTLDRRFVKNTVTLEVSKEMNKWKNHQLTIGINSEYQHNKIGGWGFLIPGYIRLTTGAFAYDKYEIQPDLFLHAGLRYDFGLIKTQAYYDWYPSEVSNKDGTISREYMQRAQAASLDFNNFSAAVGLSFLKERTTYKLNLGKSFRIPLANELASNGVNYHMYRYEKGNHTLDAEASYQLDTEMAYESRLFSFSVTPFVNYFAHYIYLNPTSEYYETQQIWEYSSSEVFRAGGEVSMGIEPLEQLRLDTSVEYVHSRQLNGPKKGFSLPFSPPLSTLVSATYSPKEFWFFGQPQVMADFRWMAQQDEIVPPENITNGYRVLNLAFQSDINLIRQDKPMKLRLKLNNVFNTKYFDHTSFYRMIDVPEPGRNLSLSITILL